MEMRKYSFILPDMVFPDESTKSLLLCGGWLVGLILRLCHQFERFI
jgi:hypothetical protein